ncbi:MAG TPA: hypothetical protein VG713_01210, partial [Pirellulales bacterium]|nr:hypothetical protein [Pirellulales bacterium]
MVTSSSKFLPLAVLCFAAVAAAQQPLSQPTFTLPTPPVANVGSAEKTVPLVYGNVGAKPLFTAPATASSAAGITPIGLKASTPSSSPYAALATTGATGSSSPVITDPAVQPASAEEPLLDDTPAEIAAPAQRPVFDIRKRRKDAWIGGFTGLLLKPHWTSTNDAFLMRVVGSNTFMRETNTPFTYGYTVSPAAWVGYVNESGNGIRVNYFQYNQAANAQAQVGSSQIILDPTVLAGNGFGVFSNAIGGTFNANSALQLSTWDLEAIRRVITDDWSWTASAGLRYAYIYQSDEEEITPVTSAGSNSPYMLMQHSFHGGGPTLSFQARRSVGDFGLGLFGSTRGSMIFGGFRQTVEQSFIATNTNAAGTNYIRSQGWGVLPIAELEVGF